MRTMFTGLGFAGLAAAALVAVSPPAAAQSLGPRLQDATIVGRGSTITITRLPVRTPDGVVYRDITIQLQLDATGGLRADASGLPPRTGTAPPGIPAAPPRASIEAHESVRIPTHDVTVGSITETATLPEVETPFVAGTYRSSAGGTVKVMRNGVSIGAAFATWSLSSIAGDSPIGSASWYAGPLRSNPHRHLAQLAGVTGDDYSYGTVDSDGGGHFDMGMLIGAVQRGSTLMIVSFHLHGCCTYSDTPTSQASFTRVGP